MRIVAMNAGGKGRMLLERWAASGHQTDAISLHVVAGLNKPIEADVILLDLRGVAAHDKAGLWRHLDGKIIIDCSNVNDVSELRSGSGSIAEEVAQDCPRASVVKALNVITAAALEYVLKQGGAEGRRGYISGYYCGNDDRARRTVAGLIEEVHLDPNDCGPLSNATLLEAVGLLTRQLKERAASGSHLAISVVRSHRDNSPLDHWM